MNIHQANEIADFAIELFNDIGEKTRDDNYSYFVKVLREIKSSYNSALEGKKGQGNYIKFKKKAMV